MQEQECMPILSTGSCIVSYYYFEIYRTAW